MKPLFRKTWFQMVSTSLMTALFVVGFQNCSERSFQIKNLGSNGEPAKEVQFISRALASGSIPNCTSEIETQMVFDTSNSEFLVCTIGGWVPVNYKPPCPNDMVDAGSYCVDKNKNAGTSWVEQAKLCQQEGKRLCTMSEWAAACHDRAALGIDDMLTGGGEYVDAYDMMNWTNGNYYSTYWTLGGSGTNGCDRKNYGGSWACSNSINCLNGDSAAVGASHPSRCCL